MKPVKKEFKSVFSRQSKRKPLDIDLEHEDDKQNRKSDNGSQEFALTRSALYRDESPSQQHSSQAQDDSDDGILDRMFRDLSTDDRPKSHERHQSTESQNQAPSNIGFRPINFDRSNSHPSLQITKTQTSRTKQFSPNERQ